MVIKMSEVETSIAVLIVDDEPPARMRLMAMVNALDGYHAIGEADNGERALAACERLQPDIVLMDIRMPGMDGLIAARHLTEQQHRPAVIFCTAYDEHALAAFDAQAVGYLLKPVANEQLQASLANAQSLNRSQLANIASPAAAGELPKDCLSVRTHNGYELLEVDEIRAFIADNKYVSAYILGRELLLDQSLKELENRFADRFIRVHRNALVARAHIRGLEKDRSLDRRKESGGHCELVDHDNSSASEPMVVRLADIELTPTVSRRHLAELRRLLKARK